MLATRLALTPVLCAVALAVGLAARRTQPRDAFLEGAVAAAFCAVAVWLPRPAGDVVMALMVGVLVLVGAGGAFGAVATGAIAYALGRVVPGGASAVVFSGGAIMAGFALAHARGL